MPQNPPALYIKGGPSNALVPATGDKQSALLVSQFHGEKYHLAYSGLLCVGANSAGVTTSAGLATTYVGICLSNPAANAVNLVLRRVAGAFIVAPATVTGMNLITGYSAAGIVTHTTALTPFSSLIGTGAAPTAKLDSACTLVGTPVFTMVLSETSTATTLPAFSLDLEGSIVLPPGGYAAIGTTIAGPASGFMGSMEWEEIPV
jgi:hypothetical protein